MEGPSEVLRRQTYYHLKEMLRKQWHRGPEVTPAHAQPYTHTGAREAVIDVRS